MSQWLYKIPELFKDYCIFFINKYMKIQSNIDYSTTVLIVLFVLFPFSGIVVVEDKSKKEKKLKEN